MVNSEEFEKEMELKTSSKDENKEKITETIDLLVNLMKVRSSLGGNVTEDYVLARLGDAERDFIRENFENAKFSETIIHRYAEKGYRYNWNEEKKEWDKNTDGSFKKYQIPKIEQTKIKGMGTQMFEFFMIQPHLIAILHRNKAENFLVKLLGKDTTEEEQIMFGKDDRSMLQKIGDKMKGEEQFVED